MKPTREQRALNVLVKTLTERIKEHERTIFSLQTLCDSYESRLRKLQSNDKNRKAMVKTFFGITKNSP